MTINATKGGAINIDGTAIRLIPYNSGSGNVPAWNTVITQSGHSGSGKLIGVYSALTAASTATGAAMPASGYIKVKQTTGTYASGALTGIGASATGADTVGWLDIVGDEAATCNANRLGTVNITGAWYSLGSTSGASNQTLQIPNSGLLRYVAGVFIEKTAGQADYEFWPNAGTATTTGTEAERGKVVWIDNTGLVRIGNSGAATNGYTPASGLAVVVPNVFLENCTTAARTANVIPNATIATRYDFTTTGGGVVSIDKCNSAWYLSFDQAFSVALTNTCAVDGISLSKCASEITWSKVGVGNKPTTVLATSALSMSNCFAGGTITDCVWQIANQANANNYTVNLLAVSGFTFLRDTTRAGVIRANASTGGVRATQSSNCTWTSPKCIQGMYNMILCTNFTITDEAYIDCVSGTTVTTYAMYVWFVSSSSSGIVMSGLTFPLTNCHPYAAIIGYTANCFNVKTRSIGTRASPLNLGSANATGLICSFSASSNAADIKVQRVYCQNTRTGIISADNSATRVTFENVFGDYADNADVSTILNLTQKGIGGTPSLAAQTAIYGTHFIDSFSSTTVGQIAILMNEATSLTTSQVTLSNGAAFTSIGSLYMPTIGHEAIFETPYYILGHTAFANTLPVMAGGTLANYTVSFDIDKNDGAGFSGSYTTATAANLAAISGISASLGFKWRIKIVTGTGNLTAITSLAFTTVSTASAQDNLYPLDTYYLTLTGLIAGSDVAITTSDTNTVVGEVDANATTSWTYTYYGAQTVDIKVIKAGYVPWVIYDYNLSTADASLPVNQVVDRAYQ